MTESVVNTAAQVGPCDETRCEACLRCGHQAHGDEGAPCIPLEGDPMYQPCDGPAAMHGEYFDHDFVAHQHTAECDARCHEAVFGCEIFRDSDGVPTYCDRRGGHVEEAHVGTHWTWGTVPPVLSDPSSDGARLAVFTMLAEAERRGWGWSLDAVMVGVYGDPPVLAEVSFDGEITVDTLPRALALALWSAVEEGS